MVKLSDYLNYLYAEVIQARKLVDEQSIKLAQEYAKHEYLKYFKVPRFTMPEVKLEIPIKINDIDSQTKYELKMNEDAFLKDVNEKIAVINKEKGLKIAPIAKTKLTNPAFKKIVEDLKSRDYKHVRKVETNLKGIDLKDKFKSLSEEFTTANKVVEAKELDAILKNSLLNQFTPISAKLNNIFIDPDTSKTTDKEKVFVKLNVELVEEGLRIVNLKDENGKEFQEIVFE